MSEIIEIAPISAEAFAPFGDLIDISGAPDKIINQGLCGRYHDRAKMDFADGRAGLSLFNAEPRSLPMRLEMVERHPEGSQAFIPMGGRVSLWLLPKIWAMRRAGRWLLRQSRVRPSISTVAPGTAC